METIKRKVTASTGSTFGPSPGLVALALVTMLKPICLSFGHPMATSTAGDQIYHLEMSLKARSTTPQLTVASLANVLRPQETALSQSIS